MRTIKFRSCSPGETFEKVSPFLRKLGVTRVAKQTGLDQIGIPVWCAYTPNAKAIVIAQGKGIDDENARTSAVMEAVERVVATAPSCHLQSQSLAEIASKGEKAHRLNCLLGTGQNPIDDNEMIQWTSASDLVNGGSIWLPFGAICFDRTIENPRFWLSTDGLASGNSVPEATLHGLLERVERDALALWNISSPNQRFCARIDPSTLDDPAILKMVALIEKSNLDLALFDVTTDLGIPTFIALLGPRGPHKHHPRHVDITLGAGTSPFPTTAISRAVSEAAQSRMTFIAGARDDLVPEIFQRPVDNSLLRAFEAPYIKSNLLSPLQDIESTEDALMKVSNHLRSHNINEQFAVDLSPDWLPVKVVKVITPQLENPDGERRHRIGARALMRSLLN